MAGERQKRKRRQRQRATGETTPVAVDESDPMARAYARGRRKDEEARAALKPLPPGERPTAVTVGAVVAALAAVANLVAMIVSFDPDSPNKSALTVAGLVILIVVAVGMWRSRYWAVLGMQTLLVLTILFAALASLNAASIWAAVLVLLIMVASGALFWFLVKAMARIQMPPRPGAR